MLKKFNPVTPGTRNLVRLNTNSLKTSPLLKNNLVGLKNNSGRNNSGRITVRRRGGGHKQKFRKLNLIKNSDSILIILSIEYDPNRSANIASAYDILSKTYQYSIAPKNIKIGDVLKSGKLAEIKNGHALPLSEIPLGSIIHCVTLKKNGKSTVSRAAGTFCELLKKDKGKALIRLCSKTHRVVSEDCVAVLGSVSNELKFLTTIGKAGRSRWLNKRPKVRGVAMNPVDHPHGGGEGKTSGGRTSVTPWGRPGKNKKTSNSKFNL